MSDFLADRGNDVKAECCEPDDDAGATEYQNPYRHCRLGGNDAGLGNRNNGRNRADGIGDIVGAVRERHATGSDNHQHREDPLDRVKMLDFLRFSIWLYASNGNAADDGDRRRDGGCQHVGVAQAEIQADVLQPLEYCDQRDRECRKKNVDGHVTFRARQWIFLVQDQSLHAQIDQERDKSRCEWRRNPAHDDYADFAPLHGIHTDADCGKTNDRSNAGVRCRHRPTVSRRNEKPGARRQERCQHAVDKKLR